MAGACWPRCLGLDATELGLDEPRETLLQALGPDEPRLLMKENTDHWVEERLDGATSQPASVVDADEEPQNRRRGADALRASASSP